MSLYIRTLLTVLFLTWNSLEEEDVLNGDIEKLIVPYATANLWVRSNNTLPRA